MLSHIGKIFYSLIVDESTAVDNKKLLCLEIIYFSVKKLKVVTTFYRLIEMRSGTAIAISSAILAQLKADNLSIDKLLGLGVDAKCICHSLHLAEEKACVSLPRHLDLMVKDTHNWFAHSTK